MKIRISTSTLIRKLKKTVEHESDNNTYCGSVSGTVSKGLFNGLEALEIRGRVEINCDIIENGQNTEKRLGNLRIIAVIQTPVKDPQPTLMIKSLKVYAISIYDFEESVNLCKYQEKWRIKSEKVRKMYVTGSKNIKAGEKKKRERKEDGQMNNKRT